MPSYIETLNDGTRRVVTYKKGVGPVSEKIKAEKREEWLKRHPQFLSKAKRKELNRQFL